MSTEFQSRLLYTQKSNAVINEEQPVTVSSTIYAIRFLYPGASQHTTGRIRITCTYRDVDQFEAHAGVIERWTDKGWILVDDYTDDVFAFTCEDKFRKRLLNHAHSFILGIPLSVVDSGYLPDFDNPNPSRPKRVFNTKKTTQKKIEKVKDKKDNYKIDSSTKNDDDDDDDDDLDWL